MLYLGIAQHKRQLTVNLRDEGGSVILKRQVSTRWEKVRAFFEDLADKARAEDGFFAILEVCGMNPWLVDMLDEYGCREIVVIQPTDRSKQKTATQRLGSITKQGSRLVRYLLNQAVVSVLRFDGAMRQWFKRIKKRRGSKIACVAVMRRLATSL